MSRAGNQTGLGSNLGSYGSQGTTFVPWAPLNVFAHPSFQALLEQSVSSFSQLHRGANWQNLATGPWCTPVPSTCPRTSLTAQRETPVGTRSALRNVQSRSQSVYVHSYWKSAFLSFPRWMVLRCISYSCLEYPSFQEDPATDFLVLSTITQPHTHSLLHACHSIPAPGDPRPDTCPWLRCCFSENPGQETSCVTAATSSTYLECIFPKHKTGLRIKFSPES